jgi:hypothetical protein
MRPRARGQTLSYFYIFFSDLRIEEGRSLWTALGVEACTRGAASIVKGCYEGFQVLAQPVFSRGHYPKDNKVLGARPKTVSIGIRSIVTAITLKSKTENLQPTTYNL